MLAHEMASARTKNPATASSLASGGSVSRATHKPSRDAAIGSPGLRPLPQGAPLKLPVAASGRPHQQAVYF